MTSVQATVDYYKYCPGEEHVKLSNAICLGRRRSHYPKCHGCQFNDDERDNLATGRPDDETVDAAATMLSLKQDRDRRPQSPPPIVSLFHASDVSGAVPSPLSEDAAWRIGHAAAQFLRSKLRGYDRAAANARSMVIGRDTRPTSSTLEQALIEGVRSTGTDVVSLGIIDTPQLYFAVNHWGACGGIQVTGGHRPENHNGLQICGQKAVPLGVDTGLASIRDISARVPQHQSGTSSRLITKDMSRAYTEFVRTFMRAKLRLPRPVKVVIDAGNGAAGRWLPILFKGMRNLRVTRLHYEHTGEFVHEPNPMRSTNTKQLRMCVKEQDADFGVCFDSGAQRCVFVDDRGRTIRPEFLLAILARMLLEREPGATIILDHRSSIAAEEEIIRAGGVPVRERAGNALIKRTMSEHNAVFGADLSGCLYFRENYFCESGILALVQVINLVLRSDRRLSELVRPLQRYSTSGLLRFECEDTECAMTRLAEAHRDAEIQQFDGLTFRYPDWWFNVQPFAADRRLTVTLEARSRKLVDAKIAELLPLLGERA